MYYLIFIHFKCIYILLTVLQTNSMIVGEIAALEHHFYFEVNSYLYA